MRVGVEVPDDWRASPRNRQRSSGDVSPYLLLLSLASLERCDRRDLIVDFVHFHAIAVARPEYGLMLDTESYVRLAGCPGCGIITQGPGHVVVEAIDAPWVGVSARIRSTNIDGTAMRGLSGGNVPRA